jgi:molybdopterin synthase sulfur carrier subunit
MDDLRAHLRLRGGIWSEVLGDGKVLRCALNHQMVNPSTDLVDGAEVAFFPPVTGG